jgi:autotransporter-associated beta strand protein
VFSASRIAPHLLCTPDELANIVSKIYFNGGTLQATFDSHLTSGNLIDRSGLVHFNACVQSRGALIDSNGHNVTIDIPLEADPASPGGGLMKIGAGALTLTEAPSYTGDTVVNVGELKALAGINMPSANIYVATGAKLTATSITADKLTIGGAPVPPPTAAAATVPEPGMMALVLAAVLILAVAGFAGVCLRRK